MIILVIWLKFKKILIVTYPNYQNIMSKLFAPRTYSNTILWYVGIYTYLTPPYELYTYYCIKKWFNLLNIVVGVNNFGYRTLF